MKMQTKNNIKGAGFIILIAVLFFGLFGFLVPYGQMTMKSKATERVAEVLGPEWQNLQKEELAIDGQGNVHVIIGTSIKYGGVPVLHTQSRPGSVWNGRNRKNFWLLPNRNHDIQLVRQSDSEYQKLRQKFESSS